MLSIKKKKQVKVGRKTVAGVRKKGVAGIVAKKGPKKEISEVNELTFIIEIFSYDKLPLNFYSSGKTKKGIKVILFEGDAGHDHEQVIKVKGPVSPPRPPKANPGKKWETIEFKFLLQN